MNSQNISFKKFKFLAGFGHSIVFRLIKTVFSFYIIITFTVTSAHIASEYFNTKNEIYNEMKNIEPILKISLTEAVWAMDKKLIKSLIQGVINNGTIKNVDIILNNNTKPSFSVGPSNSTDKYESFTYNFNLYHDEENLAPIAKVIFYSDKSKVLEKVTTSFIFILMNAVIKTVFLWIIFLWSGHIYLSTPLQTLIRATKLAKSKDIGEASSNIKFKYFKNTELYFFSTAFDQMCLKINELQTLTKDTQKRLSYIIDAMPSAIICINKSNIIIEWNEQIQLITQVDKKSAIQQDLFLICKGMSKIIDILNKTRDTKKPSFIPQTNGILDKKNKFFDILIFPFEDQFEEYIIFRLDDVTNNIKLSEMLIDSEKMSSLGSLAAGVAHEINNPLGAIMQSAQNMLRRVTVDVPANILAAKECDIDLNKLNLYLEKRGIFTFIKGIQEAGERAAKVVANLLQFSRHIIAPKSFSSIITVIEKALDLAKFDYNIDKHIDFKKIKINKEYPKSIQNIFLSASEMEHVFLNILKNSAQSFTNLNADPVITITVAEHSQVVIISIKDNGCGMSENVRRRVFNPFFTTKRNINARGLGLTIAYNIVVKGHKGALNVNSSLNVGSEFIISIPIREIDV